MCFLAIGKISKAQCDVYNEIRISASGFYNAAGYTQEYVVVSNETGLITAISNTGIIDPVQPGQYLVYAVNYDGSRPGALSVGNLWSGVVTYAAANCFDILGPYNSGLINDCDNICTNDPFSATSSGFYSGGATTENYILVSTSGNILASNTSGAFTNTNYGSDGIYQVFAVNTEDATVLSALDPNDSWSTAETVINANCADKIGPYLVEVGPGLCILSTPMFNLKGELKSSSNQLKWNIKSTDEVKHFELEYSKDQSKFENIAVLNEVNYEHKNPSTKSYYRVKSIFKNGGSKYSNTISIERSNILDIISIYPNPSNGILNIDLQSNSDVVYLKLYNGLGQAVINKFINVNDGINTIQLDISNYPEAMYQLIVSDAETKIIEKITKVR